MAQPGRFFDGKGTTRRVTVAWRFLFDTSCVGYQLDADPFGVLFFERAGPTFLFSFVFVFSSVFRFLLFIIFLKQFQILNTFQMEQIFKL
jgi:hypothetical protein